MDYTNINALLETGGSFAIICGLVYFILKYVFEYLKCRDQRDEDSVSKRYEERKEERDLRFKEHTLYCETVQKQAEEFKEAVIALINKEKEK